LLGAKQITIVNPQESFKRHTSQEGRGVMQPMIWLRFPGVCDIRYFRTKLFLTSRRPFLITFTKNRICAAKHTYHTNCMQWYPYEGDFFERNFCLCVKNIMRLLMRFFFIPSHGVGIPFTYVHIYN